MVTCAPILTTTKLLALVPELVLGAFLVAVLSNETLCAFASAGVRIAESPVLAVTVLCTIFAPFIRRASHVTDIARPALGTRTLVGC